MGKHHHHQDLIGRRLWIAVIVNLTLTVVEVVGGIVAGSLALIADALHNFSDAASLLLALLAHQIARRPADEVMTYGYGRAEIIAALINFTTLMVVGIYLVYDAIARVFNPEPVTGWIMVVVAGVALVIDLVTAWLTYTFAKNSMNMRAAFIHNMADALASLGVIIAGTLIIVLEWHLADAIVTLAIAGYVMAHGASEIGGAIRILMSGAPADPNLADTIAALQGIDGVESIHHVYLWAIDEHRTSFEAHVVTTMISGEDAEALKARLRAMLDKEFGISHSTLELEFVGHGTDCGHNHSPALPGKSTV
ncbi:MAG: cation diffusion facilitator family transporter [Gammaproteobacteria bacterium]